MKEVNIKNGKIVLKNLKNLLHIEYINYKVPKAENAAKVELLHLVYQAITLFAGQAQQVKAL